MQCNYKAQKEIKQTSLVSVKPFRKNKNTGALLKIEWNDEFIKMPVNITVKLSLLIQVKFQSLTLKRINSVCS